MDIFDDLSIGPFSLPFRFIFAGGILALAVLVARIPLRGRRLVRSAVTERLINAALFFVAAWKLTPAVTHPALLLRDPLPLLMAAPGPAGVVLGAAAAAAYLGFALLRRRRLRKASVIPLAIFVAVTAVGWAGGWVASSLTLPFGQAPRTVAPALSLPTLGGTGVSLEALKGRVVVVNFWATWCPPCRAELPDLAAFARSQGSRGAVLVGVNATFSETSEQAVRAFADGHGVDFSVALDGTGDVTRAWGIRVWPTTFVVDPYGRIAAQRSGALAIAWLRHAVRIAGGN